MIRTSILAVVLVLALVASANAKCVAASGGDGYPAKQEALLLCQQQELSETVDDAALAEELRAIRGQLQAMQLQQQRLLLRPIEARLPGF